MGLTDSFSRDFSLARTISLETPAHWQFYPLTRPIPFAHSLSLPPIQQSSTRSLDGSITLPLSRSHTRSPPLLPPTYLLTGMLLLAYLLALPEPLWSCTFLQYFVVQVKPINLVLRSSYEAHFQLPCCGRTCQLMRSLAHFQHPGGWPRCMKKR